MRKHAAWMAQPDDRILEVLREEGPLKDWAIRHALDDAGVDMGYPAQYLKQRHATLGAYDLIEENSAGRYQVTDRGLAYLEGRLDAGTLEDDRESESTDTGSTEFII